MVALLVAASFCGHAALAQPAPVAATAGTLQQFLSGDLVPLDLKFSQMQSGWSRVNIERKGELRAAAAPTFMPPDPIAQGFRRYFGQNSDAVWTQGRTVNLNGSEQLVVYRADFPGDEESRVWLESRFTDKMQAVELNPEKFVDLVLPVLREFLDTVPLRASLVSVETIGSLENVQSFDYDRAFAAFGSDIREKYKADIEKHVQQRAAISPVSLGMLAQGFKNYLLDYDDTLPPMETWDVANQALQPYIKSEITLAQSGQQIYSNPLLSKKKLAHLAPFQNAFVVFYTSPDDQNNRWIVMLDGEVKSVNANQWLQVKQASRLP